MRIRKHTQSLDNLREFLVDLRDKSIEIREQWMLELEQSPSYALQWAVQVYAAVTNEEVAANCLNIVEHVVADAAPSDGSGRILARVLEHLRVRLTQAALRGASHPARSTSPTSNLYETEQARAAASIFSTLFGSPRVDEVL